LAGLRFGCGAEQLNRKRQERGAPSVGQETEVADAHKTFGAQMRQEAAQELDPTIFASLLAGEIT
jgi:hypothetical protein